MVSTKVLNTSMVSSAHVRRELRRSSRQVLYCYQRQLRHDDKLAGELSVRGVINAHGKFESMQVLGNSVHPAVGVCVQNVLMRFRFKKSTATGLTPALVIEQSWSFNP